MRPESVMFARRARLGSVAGAALLLAACAGPATAPRSAIVEGPLKVKLIAFNDFHGNLEAPGAIIRAPAGGLSPEATDVDVSVPAGGAARFATMIKTLAAENPNHVIVASGDLIGASPLVSALFLDEPTIEALNTIGVEFSSIGNHEFDRGVAELKRKQTGGCERYVDNLEPCRAGHRFEGAHFKYLAANVIDKATGQPIFPAYGIKTFEGVPVGFIGLTLHGTGQIVDPIGVAGVTFEDEATVINARAAELRSKGVNTIVVLIHEGGFSKARLNEKTCPGLTGDILPILDKLDASIDVVASAHTHQPYVCTYRSFLLTSASSYGRLVTSIDLDIDRATGRVLHKTAANHVVAAEGFGEFKEQAGYPLLARDPLIAAEVDGYVLAVAPYANRKVGTAAVTLSNREDASGQSPLGDIIVDADLAATRAVGAQIALLNPGSVRAPVEPVDGAVTYGALFRTQPFGNNLVTITMTGAQLKAVLEQQWLATRQQAQILQVSQGFGYSYDLTRPLGSRIDAASMHLGDKPIVATGDYRVTINSFMLSGGDGFTGFGVGRDKVTGGIDVDAAVDYFKSHPGMVAPAAGRVVRLDR